MQQATSLTQCNMVASSLELKHVQLFTLLGKLTVLGRLTHCLQCFDAVGWASGRASGL